MPNERKRQERERILDGGLKTGHWLCQKLGKKVKKTRNTMKDGIGRKEIFKIFQKSCKENKKKWIQDGKHVKGCSFSKPK